MYKKMIYNGKNICCYVVGTISIIKLKQNVFEEIVDLVNGGKLFFILSEINNNSEIEALLLINELDSLIGSNEYENFIMKNVLVKEEEKKKSIPKNMDIKKNRAREINVLRSLILKLVDLNKITVSCLSGEIVTPFFGLNLAVDFRFGTKEMKFLLDHRRFGLHPSGALPFFLKHYVNRSKQNEILYCKDEIGAKEALDLGLIDKILPKRNFEKNSIKELNKIIEKNRGSINKTRLMMKYSISELIEYFDRESVFIK